MAKEQAAAQGAEAPAKKKKAFKKRGEKRIVHHGFVHVQASFSSCYRASWFESSSKDGTS